MSRLARWCFRHRRTVLPAWILALIIVAAISHAAGSSYSNNFTFPSTDSSRAEDVVKANFPAQSGDSDQIVVQAKTGTLSDPSVKSAVLAMLDNVQKLPFVTNVVTPYDSRGGLISKDGTIGLATVQLNQQVQNVSTSDAKSLVNTAQAARSATLDVQLGGASIQKGENQGGGSADFIGGALLALIVLYFAFRRSILSAVLPLMSAIGAIGVGISLVGLLSHVITMPEFSTQLAELISLGVGIDYALFIVNRHRRELLAGHTPEEAAIRALNTSGRAVLVAGMTVCIALLSMFAMGLSFLYGVAVASSIVVALTMLASLTLLPAMLGFYGPKALARGERRSLDAAGGSRDGSVSGFWVRWSNMIGEHSTILSVVALGLIVVIALPFFSMRLGIADSGEDPSSSTTRHAYDLLAKGFGPGFNGPLQVVGEVNGPGDATRYDSFIAGLSGQPGVARVVLPSRVSPNGKALVTFVYPEYSPQAVQTTNLVNHIRSEAKTATTGSTLAVHVGGLTAGGIDFARVLSSKIPLFVTVIVVLAFILLAIVFRSLLVPLTASIMNLLSIGAALGTMVAAFQFGWAKSLLGFSHAGPIEVYLPVMVFAVLFGLSMDYEVFLVSRMHEEWILTGDNDRAVKRGQSETGRVITAAALIMILVFLSFSLLGNALVIQEFGIGFAAAIVIDAFVVRTVLVPALMHLFGRANWWIPSWLDQRLPTLHIEADDLARPEGVLEGTAAGAR